MEENASMAQSILGGSRLVAFASTVDPARAKQFYGETLGLRLVAEDEFALMFDANGTPLRVSAVREMTPAPYTVLGWQVQDIMTTAKELRNAGVVFERYAALDQDADGIWTAPGGAKVAWFKDRDGNVLSISQH
jgi:catechol 2,3-dioxygenase-like lactoylglutathione lyase family enzyme